MPSARMVQVRWQRTDLDFPVLMLRTSAWPPSLASLRGGPLEGLSIVSFSYGDGEELLTLQTVARRGRRMGLDGPEPVGDPLVDQVGQAVSDLLLTHVRPGDQPASATRQRVDDAVERGRQMAAQFPGPPWLVRSVPVDGADFAMWFTTLSPGFAAVLDYGPVVLTAWGSDPDIWDWHLTAVPPSAVWPLISEALHD